MVVPAKYSRIIREFGEEFLIESADNLDDLSELVNQIRAALVESPAGLMNIRRTIHNMKGMGGSFEFPLSR